MNATLSNTDTQSRCPLEFNPPLGQREEYVAISCLEAIEFKCKQKLLKCGSTESKCLILTVQCWAPSNLTRGGKLGSSGGPRWRGLSPCSSGERAEIPRVPPPVPAARPAQYAPTASPGYQATWLPGKGSATTAGTVGHGASVVGVGGEGLWGQKRPERTHLQATDPQGAGPWFGLPWGTEQRGHPGQHLWATPSFRPLSARPPRGGGGGCWVWGAAPQVSLTERWELKWTQKRPLWVGAPGLRLHSTSETKCYNVRDCYPLTCPQNETKQKAETACHISFQAKKM